MSYVKISSIMKKLLSTLLILSFCGATQASTLQIMYQLALENDPQYQGAKEALKAGTQLKKQGRAALLPTISFDVSYSKNKNTTVGSDAFSSLQSGDATQKDYSFSASQELFNLGVFYGYKQILANVSVTEAQYKNQQQDVILRTSQRYFGVLRAVDFYNTLLSEQEALQQQLEQTKQSYEVGLVAITDVYDAQTSIDLLTAQIIEAKGNISISEQQLMAITNKPMDKIATIKDIPHSKPKPDKMNEWVELAKLHSHTLTEAQQLTRVAEYNYKVKRSAHYPTVSFGWRLRNNDLSRTGAELDDLGVTQITTRTSDTRDNSWQISLNMPLFTGGRISSERRQAYYQKRQQEFNLEQTQRLLVQNVQSTFLLVNTNDAQIKAYDQSIKSSKSALDSTQAGYESGTRNLVDVLIAQRNLFQAQRNYSNSRYDYLVNMLQLKYLTGILDASDVNQLDDLLNKTDLIDLSVF